MTTQLVVAASVLGAVCLYVLVQPGRRAVRLVAAVVGLAAFGWLLANVWTVFGGDAPRIGPDPFMLVAASIALIGAVRVITHATPVYCALYFILVVLASAALFLLLGAEFMAFALIIVYAGAILITYLFVLMLAQQAEAPGDVRGQADYDLAPREPAAAVMVGGLLLAVLLGAVVRGLPDLARAPNPDGQGLGTPPQPPPGARTIEAWHELERMPEQFKAAVLAAEPMFAWPPIADASGHRIQLDGERAFVVGPIGASGELSRVDLPASAMPSNIQRVGWALVAKFPASLELAGVILLLAMFGAVVLARRHIELGEDEKRAALGMRRLADDEADSGTIAAGGPGR